MNKHISAVLGIMAISTLSSPVAAEDGFYAGIGLGFSAMKSAPWLGAPIGSEVGAQVVGVTAGYRKDVGNAFIAGELDVDLSGGLEFEHVSNGLKCSDAFPNNTYYCTHDSTVRARGIVGMPAFSDVEVFGSLGIGMISGTGIYGQGGETDAASSAGLTLGLGMLIPVQSGAIRFEVIHDQFDNTIDKPNGNVEPTYEATSLKASYLISF